MRAAEIPKPDRAPLWFFGFESPYSDTNEFAWQALSNELSDGDKVWLAKIASRNRDLASFLVASFLALFISLIVHLAFRWPLLFSRTNSTLMQVSVSYVVLCVNSWMLFGCVNIVCRNTRAAFKLYQLAEQKRDRADGPALHLTPKKTAE